MRTLILLLYALATSAHAEVTASSPTGFTNSFRREVQATPQQAIAALERISQWWSPDHTYSGKSTNLRLALKAGECFCEDWEGSSTEHARVLLVMRNQLVRLDGALGPLQELGAHGVLTLSSGTAEGKTFVRMVYRVSGSPDMNLDKLAPIVDRVMGEQFTRWANHTEGKH